MVLTKLTARFFRTEETPDSVKLSSRFCHPHGKTQYKMYGIAPSCVDVLFCCSLIQPQVNKNSFYIICDKLATK